MSFWRIFERDLLARKVMKIGLQTIAWNDSPIETVIREASSAGFAGVEIAQSISDDQFKMYLTLVKTVATSSILAAKHQRTASILDV